MCDVMLLALSSPSSFGLFSFVYLSTVELLQSVNLEIKDGNVTSKRRVTGQSSSAGWGATKKRTSGCKTKAFSREPDGNNSAERRTPHEKCTLSSF